MASGRFAPDLAGEREVAVLRGAPPDANRIRALSEAALAEAAGGRIHPVIGQEHALARAAAAHHAIESRATTGKTLLAVRNER